MSPRGKQPSGLLTQQKVLRAAVALFLEKGCASIMRGYMTVPCDLYFTIERKLRRFLSCCMRLYCVPEEKQEQVIARVLQMDLRTQAQEIVGEAVRRAEAGFEAVMADTGQA